jgi:fructose transport system permease protein
MVILFGIFWYVLNNTPWGRHVYAVGDDAPSAQLAGIRIDKVLISVYATAGVLCGLAGWAAIGRVGSVSPQSFYEGNLDAITAVVIGGTSLFGGRGSILGTLFGALIDGVFNSGLALAGLDPLWRLFTVGVLIIVAVALDQWIRRIAS